MATPKRGLGRGLDALLGEAAGKEERHGGVHSLPVELIRRGRFQPRQDLDADKLQELADSIRAHGIIQPIIVRPLADDHYEIVAGERRWRAAQLAGLAQVPVIVKDIDDRATIAQTLIENIQREDLNPLEEAEALRRLLDEFGMTHQQIAEAVGKSRAAITNLLRLLELAPEVKRLLLARQLDMGHARALLGLAKAEQPAAAQAIVRQGLSVRAAEQLVRRLQQPAADKRRPAADPDTLRLQDDLSCRLGAPVVINHHGNGSGKLIIRYANLDELDNILSQIK